MSNTTDNQQIEKSVRDFIAVNLLYSTDGFPHKDDTSLLKEGIIDSLGVVELIEFAQKEYGVKVEPLEVTPDNFDSVAKLCTFIRRKRGVA
ncbi:MAG: acyl carrier protein [Verrucomicrobiales bacterium]|nr:MAG: acyl carrier protein [Verrucomicrobiales bacterium]